MKTSNKQISLFGETELTSLRVDFPANHTQQQENGRELMTSAICGRKCLEQFERLNHVGSWEKTFAALLIGQREWFSTRCKLTWKMRGTKFSRYYFQLRVSTHPTNDTGFSLLPTPVVMDTAQNADLNKLDQRRQRAKEKGVNGNGFGYTIGELYQRGLLPTPQTIDSGTAREPRLKPGRKANTRGNFRADLKDVFLPTPTTNDSQNMTFPESQRFRESLVGMLERKFIPTPTKSTETIQDMLQSQYRSTNRGKYKELLPTPLSSDCGNKITGVENQDSLTKRAREITGKTSLLNHRFVLEMMGFPPNWFDSEYERRAMELLQKKKSTKSYKKRLHRHEKQQSTQAETR